MSRSRKPQAGLTFPWNKVNNAITELGTATEFRTLYGTQTGPGFWLVGDEGVYLMPNLKVHNPMIIYARECDPTKMPFDDWWEYKRASFGEDDGIEFIAMTDIEGRIAAFKGTPRYLLFVMEETQFRYELR